MVTPGTLQRRFALLSAMTWLPRGLFLPVMVLLATSRGLDLATVAVVFAAHSITVAALELPTGGLADVIGRRQVLTASASMTVIACLLFAVATDPLLFVLASVIQGTARALSSGPLEAWYVDAVHAARDDADLKPGLALGQSAGSVALGVGAVTGGLLPLAAAGLGMSSSPAHLLVPLSVPALAAATASGLHLVAILALMAEPPRHGPRARLGEIARDVPRTVSRGARLGLCDRVLPRVLAGVAGTGVLLAAFELLTPVRLAGITGSESAGASVYGTLATLGFFGSAAGAGLGPWLANRLGSPARSLCALALATAVPVVVFGTISTLVAVSVAYVTAYMFLGAAGPSRHDLLHSRVSASERATVLSVNSLVLQGAAVAGSIGLGALTQATSFTWAMLVAAAAIALTALAYLRLTEAPASASRAGQLMARDEAKALD